MYYLKNDGYKVIKDNADKAKFQLYKIYRECWIDQKIQIFDKSMFIIIIIEIAFNFYF